MTKPVVRFAPSPTGYLHIGGLRTALYNYLFAKRMGGKFILRIEDTDRTRFVEGAIENLIDSLHWAGLSYDEGVFVEDKRVVQKGENGPYIQSERLPIYKKYVDKLIEEGYAYYCFCSKDRLDSLREEQKIKGQVPKYDGLCRGVSLEDAKKRIAAGEDYVVRLKLPHDENITFTDIVRGEVTINTNEIDDQVLMKSDGFPTYHMAVVVDDHLMGVTHIVRGEEWLSSTPKHVYLYKALGWDAPTFVHLPTVLNKNRKKLSKREGDVSVEDFKKRGYLPEGLINYLALVGWSPEDEKEIFSLKELEEVFSFERVGKSGGIFDKDKLDWVNAHYVKEYPLEKIVDLSIPFVEESGYMTKEEIEQNPHYYEVMIGTIRDSLSRLDEIKDRIAFIFDEFEIKEESALEALKGETVKELLQASLELISQIEEFDEENSKTFMKTLQKATGIKGKNLYMPFRAAISGNVHGPEMNNIIYLLGKERIEKRVKETLERYL